MSQLTKAISNSGPGGFIQTLTGDAGPAQFPTAGNINIFGAHGINTLGTVSTITVAIDNTITLGDLVAVGPGVDSLTLTTGDMSLGTGNINFLVDSSATGGCITYFGTRFMQNGGGGAESAFLGGSAGNFSNGCFASVGIGESALGSYTSASHNTAAGYICLAQLNTGNQNSSYGSESLGQLRTGSGNLGLGFQAGNNYIGAESNNIVLLNQGVAAESGVIRIGTNGTHNSCFITGIDGVNVGSVAKVVTMASDKLGTATITAGANITVTPGANTITIAATASPAGTYTYTNVNTTPYVVLAADVYISVDASGGARTIQLPNAATSGRFLIIKDRTGSAASNNITVTTVGGAVNIDGATTFVMNTAYESIQVIGNGTTYEVF